MLPPRRLLVPFLGLALALPSAAGAAPYEQVSRATGPAGAAISGRAVAIGDVGRYAAFRSDVSYIRDIRTNVTTPLGADGEVSVIGFNRAETFALLLRRAADGDRLVAAPLPIGSAPERVVYATSGPALAESSVRLSADGSTAVLNDAIARELRSVDVASGTVTTLATSYPDGGWRLGEYAVSANGRTVLATNYTAGKAIVFERSAAGAVTTVPTELGGGQLSPDGSAVLLVGFSGKEGWVARDPIGPGASTSTRFTPPAPTPIAGSLAARWISADGSTVVVARKQPGDLAGYPAFAVTIATGAVAPFGGRFRESIAGEPNQYGWGSTDATIIAPGGRKALMPVSGQLVLADLSGAHMIGANEPLSADTYFNFWNLTKCTNTLGQARFFGTQTLKVRRPATWAPLPARYDVQMLADTTLLRSGSPTNGETWTANWSGRPRYHRAKVTVTLPDGQVTSAERRLNGAYYGACYS